MKGFQVAPCEIEGVLLEHEHVINCAVVRVIRSVFASFVRDSWTLTRYRRDGREHPRAFIVRSDNKITGTDIMEFLEARLSAHKKPTGGIVFVDAIPKSPSGKILRRMLQEPASKEIAHL